MGITRKTVVEWEGKGRISPQHDMLLRAQVYAHLGPRFRPGAGIFERVRMAAPRVRLPPVQIGRIDEAA